MIPTVNYPTCFQIHGWAVRLIEHGQFEVTVLRSSTDVRRVLLGYDPNESVVVAVVSCHASALAALPSRLTRVPTADPKVELWI